MEDFFGVCLDFGLGDHLFQNTLFVDDKRRAMGAVVLAPHEFLQSPNAVSVVDAQFFIAEQVEFQAKFVDEFVVRLCRILADPQDLVTVFRQRLEVVVQVASGGAPWGVVLGVEVQNQFGAFEFFQRANVAVLVRAGKLGARSPALRGEMDVAMH